jgi:hypothetical protein
MTDEEEDYSSDESSVCDEQSMSKQQTGELQLQTRGVLTLEDNDDDADQFQRPDLVDMYEDACEGEGEEEEDEFAGEVEEIDLEYLDKSKGGKINTAANLAGLNGGALGAKTSLSFKSKSSSSRPSLKKQQSTSNNRLLVNRPPVQQANIKSSSSDMNQATNRSDLDDAKKKKKKKK